ncbi:MAG: T9SS type A sorting domain-containing protein [Ignavibacteria bacterium]
MIKLYNNNIKENKTGVSAFRTAFLLFFIFLATCQNIYAMENIISINDTLPGWTYKRTNSSHLIAIQLSVNVDIDGSGLEAGDYLGVFYSNNGASVCAGYVKWEGDKNVAMTAWGDDALTTQKDGFAANEAMQWKVWKKSRQQSYSTVVSYKNGPGVFTSNALSELGAIVSVSTAHPGWYPPTTGQSHIIAIPLDIQPSIKGVPLKSGDYIGVFYDSSGTLACGGYVRWDGLSNVAVTAYGDDASTQKKEGFSTNEKFKWKLWRLSDKTEFYAVATYRNDQPNDSLFAVSGLSSLLTLIETAYIPPDTTLSNDSSFVINTGDIAFGNINKISSYRIFSIPGLSLLDGMPINFEDVIFPDAPRTNWLAFKTDGDGNLTIYNESNKGEFVFTAGNAFWVISKNKIRLDALWVKSAQVSSDNTYSIALHRGWNMISNPFPRTVDWNNVKSANYPKVSDPIWAYSVDGKYVKPAKMQPFNGYYYYNRKNLDSLKIPYPLITKVSIDTTPGTESNSFSLMLYKNEELSGQVSIIFDKTSSEGQDDLDQFAPPHNFNQDDIYLYNDKFESPWKALASESRNNFDAGEVFTVKIITGSQDSYKLKTQGLERFNGYEIMLLNILNGNSYDLNKEHEINLTGQSGSQDYRLIIGKKEYSDKMINEYSPKEYLLWGNFPNPFNPSTNISYYLPYESNVNIRIFNMLGEEVANINNGLMTSGNQKTVWNAGNFPSGIYLFILEAKSSDGSRGFKASGKLSLLK